MGIIPKKTKYRLQFRNKIQSKKVLKYEHRMRFGSQGNLNHFCNNMIKQTLQSSLKPLFLFRLKSFTGSETKVFGPNKSVINTRKAWLPINNAPNGPSFFGEQQQQAEHFLPISYDYGNNLLFGKYGFAVQNHGKLRSKLISTLRWDISKMLKKKAKVWLRLCCDTPVTARPVETRMGKGKGPISYYEAKVKPGAILFEFSGIDLDAVKVMHYTILKKFPLSLRLVH